MSTFDVAAAGMAPQARFSSPVDTTGPKPAGERFESAPPPLHVIPRPAGGAAPPDAHAAAVSRIQAHVQHDLDLQKTPGPDGLVLRPNTQSIFMPQPNGVQAKGTVVMYHGFTAGPYQYKEMAQRFYDAGYNVYVPRMLGHGYADASGMPTGSKIPDANHRGEWEKFVDNTFNDAQALGAPVYGVGLSGGADLALCMAERHPEVKGTAAMSTYLGGDGVTGLVFKAVDDGDALTGGVVGELLDHIPFQKNKIVPNDPLPHTEGNLGQAMVMQEVGHNLKHISSPVQLLSTDGDSLSGEEQDAALLQKLGGPGETGWYRFPKSEGVPHAMLSPAENKVPGAAQTVSDVVFNFIDKGDFTNRGS